MEVKSETVGKPIEQSFLPGHEPIEGSADLDIEDEEIDGGMEAGESFDDMSDEDEAEAGI
jgi:hypothetical protein